MSVFNKTKKEKIESAHAQDLQMLKFEKPLERDLNKFFKQLSNDFVAMYATTGQILPLESYTSDMQGLLKKHYRPTSEWFSKVMKRELTADIKDSDDEFLKLIKKERDNKDDEILAILTAFILSRSQNATTSILNTTNKIMDKHVFNVINSAALDDEILTDKQIAKKAGNLITTENVNRSSLISQTEAGTIASEAKEVEGLEVQKIINKPEVIALVGIGLMLQKTWITIGDERVRESHIMADGQIVNINANFFVGGEYLKAPRMGSIAANNINCRCQSIID